MQAELQKKLDAIEDTPIKEPGIYELLTATPLNRTAVLKKVVGDDINKYPAMELAELFHAITQKVTSLTNEDGSFKSTPLTQECDTPNFEESEQISDLYVKMSETENAEDIHKELEALAWEISKLNKDKLSEWERSLVVSQVLQAAIDVSMTSLGKPLKH